jgi:malate dehydrogenase (oxaloacetate-decarboxylating)(NADP+)
LNRERKIDNSLSLSLFSFYDSRMREPIVATGERPLPRGISLLNNPLLNKGMAFSTHERDVLGLRGLLPPQVLSIEQQADRVLASLRSQTSALDKYISLTALQQRNEVLFYHLLLTHLEEMMPLIYTPTVGEACLEYGNIWRRPRGLFLSYEDKGHLHDIMRNWPNDGVRMILVTDGERILGLGDLGAYGMGISIGKLSLYTACAGVHPYYCLPVVLDVGTDNEALRQSPNYIGLRQSRVRGPEYDDFVTEFMESAEDLFPGSLIQFEDFGNRNAFRLLDRWRDNACVFNDDIQGTAAVAVAGMIASLRASGKRAEDQRILFMGAGEAGLGIAALFTEHLVSLGLSYEQARRTCWFIDSKGLVVASRLAELAEHKKHFAHEAEFAPDLLSSLHAVKPTVLIGVSGAGRVFTREIIELMAEYNERPIIFALSNPTSKAECTSHEAIEWSQGRAIFASGSPMPPVEYEGRRIVSGQGNNVYIFPGVGLGVLATQACTVTDSMFLVAARTLSEMATPEELAEGRVYPSLARIREVSLRIAVEVARVAFQEGLAQVLEPADLEADITSRMFNPVYSEIV